MSSVYKCLPYIEPKKLFDIVGTRYATVFLESSLEHNYYGRYSFIGIDPVDTISPKSGVSLQEQLEKFEELKKYHPCVCAHAVSGNPPGENLPFTGGLMGFISYDYARRLEPHVISVQPVIPVQVGIQLPYYWFGIYNQVFAFDKQEKICYLLVTELSDADIDGLLSKLENIYNSAVAIPQTDIDNPKALVLKSNFTKETYANAVKKAVEYIKAGDIFEANLAQKFSAKIDNNYKPEKLFCYLQYKNPAPFSAYLNLDKLKILSASPERFIKITNNEVEVRPIKGTIRRNPDLGLDNFLAQTLQSSSKDRAENIMIVDLMRNDLSKICEADSIVVKQLCGLESFTNVHHLVSVINGRLKSDIGIFDIIKAIFPAGSITGAPKIRAQQIIDELEQNTPRGISYGSVGYIGFNGNIDLSVAIRTITIYNDELSFHVGGAVTLYSDPIAEYEESMLKAQKLFETIT